MKSNRKELWFDVPARRMLRNITPEVERCLAESGVKEPPDRGEEGGWPPKP
jgi:thiamine phosphate synthase YjbQ (UPF0047 family)